MPRIEYVGPADEIKIPFHQVIVKRGESFAVNPGDEGRAPGDWRPLADGEQVPDDHASRVSSDGTREVRDLGVGLLAQEDNFRLAQAKPDPKSGSKSDSTDTVKGDA